MASPETRQNAFQWSDKKGAFLRVPRFRRFVLQFGLILGFFAGACSGFLGLMWGFPRFGYFCLFSLLANVLSPSQLR